MVSIGIDSIYIPPIEGRYILPEHNLVYKINFPDCSATYIGETARRLEERVQDHTKRDKNSRFETL